MHVAHLTLHDFRSYADIDVALEPGATAFIGRNGQGKTNLVEAIDYLSRLSSHRVATDAPLVRAGADQAIVRASVVKEGRTALLEVELNPGRANRARINRSPLPAPARDHRPGAHRRLRARRPDAGQGRPVRPPQVPRRPADPAHAAAGRASGPTTTGSSSSATACSRPPASRAAASRDAAMSTLEIWDDNLARVGAEILGARLQLVEDLRPYLGKAYEAVARGASRDDADLDYKASIEVGLAADRGRRLAAGAPRGDRGAQAQGRARPRHLPGRPAPRRAAAHPRQADLRLPVKGYACHGESWSFALALRLASYDLLRADGDDPILVLDDVFAELDTERRSQLAELVAGAEQVLVTAAVAADVPEALRGVALRGGRRAGDP